MKLTEHRHSCGKRKLWERETVPVSYDTLRCIYIHTICMYICVCIYIYIYNTALLRYSCCIECQDPFRGHAESHKGHLSRGPGKAWVLYQHLRNLLWLLIPCGSMWSFQVVLSCFMCSLSPSCNFAQLQCFDNLRLAEKTDKLDFTLPWVSD